MDNLLYRRQFVLGNRAIEEFTNWDRLEIHNGFFLTSHPDLETTISENEHQILIGAGIFLDPLNPLYSNKQIIDIINQKTLIADIIKETYQIGGRWTLIFCNKKTKEKVIFNDPSGDRQVFYTKNLDTIWCASQPHVLAGLLKIKNSTDKDLLDFVNHRNHKITEHGWIGNETPFEKIYHLLPNQCLDLNTGIERRFFPIKNIILNNTEEEILNTCTALLKGTFDSLANRYPLAMAVTCGGDSRVLLAATKHLKNKIQYFICHYPSLRRQHFDIKIPKKLFKKLGVAFYIENALAKVKDLEFLNFLHKNIYQLSAEKNINIYYSAYLNRKDRILIGGGSGGITRNHYGRRNIEATPAGFAKLFERENEQYAIKEFEKWLDGLKGFPNHTNSSDIGIYDLLFWEQKVGNWQAMGMAEEDLISEGVRPFNNRMLIINFLSIPRMERTDPDILFYKKIIQKSWPELLMEPINPISWQKSIIKIVLKKTGLFKTAKKILRLVPLPKL